MWTLSRIIVRHLLNFIFILFSHKTGLVLKHTWPSQNIILVSLTHWPVFNLPLFAVFYHFAITKLVLRDNEKKFAVLLFTSGAALWLLT